MHLRRVREGTAEREGEVCVVSGDEAEEQFELEVESADIVVQVGERRKGHN